MSKYRMRVRTYEKHEVIKGTTFTKKLEPFGWAIERRCMFVFWRKVAGYWDAPQGALDFMKSLEENED